MFTELSMERIADQALIADYSAQAIAKGGATEKQIFEGLRPERVKSNEYIV